MANVGPAVKFSATNATVRTAPPVLGEHTEEVLAELGITAEDLKGLRNDGVV